MAGKALLEKNLKRWEFFCPQASKLIPQVECFYISGTENPDGKLNLKYGDKYQTFFLHSTENVEQEAKEWFSSLNLQNISVLYVYGIGLGYYYKAVKPWLEMSKKHTLVFLEDDLEVLRIFFETQMAEEILNDTQVRIFYLDWNNKEGMFQDIVKNFIFQSFKISALNSYALYKKKYVEVSSLLAYQTSIRSALTGEYISSGMGFFSNYYLNLLKMSSSYIGNNLFDQFKDIPAIICGAGPSLEKNIDLLGKLKDRALIFAGGTAMNAINTKGVNPHFGIGIDPNVFQFSRIIANQAFEVPFFYRNRMYHEALNIIHGEHLYITGAGGYILSDWIEEKLGIPTGTVLSEGFNVINFSLAIALAMGCNPIIFAGVDLAYSGDRSYTPGLFHHAIHDPKQDFRTKSTEEELIDKKDINGEPIQTLWKWIHEALWFSQTGYENPENKFYNCTEGGLGFPGIQNMSLAEAAVNYLSKQYDLEGMVHCAVQNSPMPESVTKGHVLDVLKELYADLKKCLEIFQKIEKIYSEMQSRIAFEKDIPDDYITAEISRLLAPLQENPAYKTILQVFESKYIDFANPRFREIDYDTSLAAEDIHLRKLELLIQRYRFLQTTAKINIDCIDKVLSIQDEAYHTPPNGSEKGTEIIDEPPYQVYAFINNLMAIHDPELDLDYKSSAPSQIQINTDFGTYPNGSKKCEQFVLQGKLHGPSTFYLKDGTPISKSWFIEGKKQGKSWFYYPNGRMHSRLRYKNGAREGKQEYFYPNGQKKSVLNYKNGQLDGPVYLFHPNGKMKRELHFVNGHRDGEEKFWNEQGLLLIEAEYAMDKPIRTAREWYENGNLSKEIIYDSDSKRLTYRRWDEGGAPWKPEVVIKEDYFDKVTKQTLLLTESLVNIVKDMKNISLAIPYSMDTAEINEEIRQIELHMENLHKKGMEMQFESGNDPSNPSEAIWKSDSMKREIQKQLESMSIKMGKQINTMHELIHLTCQILDEKQKKKSNDEKNKSNEN